MKLSNLEIESSDLLRVYLSTSEFLHVLHRNVLLLKRADTMYDFQNIWLIEDGKQLHTIVGTKANIMERCSFNGELTPLSELAYKVFSLSFYLGDAESHALWQTGTSGGPVVAIGTTPQRIEDSILQSFNQELFLVETSYVDAGSDTRGIRTFMNKEVPKCFFLKDEGYSFENEAMLLLNNSDSDAKIDECPDYVSIPIRVEKWIDHILVRPDVEDFVYDTIAELAKRYVPNCVVRRSTLNKLGNQ